MKTQPASQLNHLPLPTKQALSVLCLRCNTELADYRPTRFTFLPYGISRAHAMLVCPKCGHVEFLSKDSPLLNELEPITTDLGDGD